MLTLLFLVALEPTKVLVVRTSTPTYEAFDTAFTRELTYEYENFDIQSLKVKRKHGFQEFTDQLRSMNPQVLILVDRWSVALYRSYLRQHPPTNTDQPATILLFNVRLDQDMTMVPNATGIRYNIPAITGITNLRSITPGIDRVGVIYRPLWEWRFLEEAKLSEREGVQLIGVRVAKDPTNSEIRQAFKKLKKLDVQALWIFNDARILKPDQIRDIWHPLSRRFRWPVVVGVENLATKVRLGHLAVYPDVEGLGIQTASMVVELEENGWDANKVSIQLPVSVRKFFNGKYWPKRRQLNVQALSQEFDEIKNVKR